VGQLGAIAQKFFCGPGEEIHYARDRSRSLNGRLRWSNFIIERRG